MGDPNVPAYAINTSTLPLYVLPPEQYSQQFGQQTIVQPGSVQPQMIYTQAPQQFAPPQSYFPAAPPPYMETGTVLSTQRPQNAGQKLEASLLATESMPPCMSGTISKAFTIFSQNCGACLLWLLCVSGILGGFITGMYFLGSGHNIRRIDPWVYLLPQLFVNVFIPPLLAGFSYAALQAVRAEGNRMAASHFFHACQPRIAIMIIAIKFMSGFLVALGFILLIVPGVYLAICLLFSELLYLEFGPHGLTVTQCLSISKTVVSRHWCWWFGFSLLLGLLSLVPFCWPVALIALVIAFRDTFGQIEAHDASAYAMSTNL